MKHTYEKPVITVDAGWQKGFMRRAVLQQLKFESAAYSNK